MANSRDQWRFQFLCDDAMRIIPRSRTVGRWRRRRSAISSPRRWRRSTPASAGSMIRRMAGSAWFRLPCQRPRSCSSRS